MKKESRLALRLALIYAAFGLLWISLSDRFLASVITDSASLTKFQTYKGFCYVVITSALVYFLAKQTMKQNFLTEEKLHDSEERWKFALEGAGDGVWDWNPQTDEAFFSKRWNEIIGYTEHEFPATGSAWVAHLHPDDKDRVLSVIQGYLTDSREIYDVEYRIRCKDGSWKWILARGMLVSRDVYGKPLRMIGTHSDITQRKVDEELVLKNLEKWKKLFDILPIGVSIVNSKNGIVDFNPSLEAILGISKEGLLQGDYDNWEYLRTDNTHMDADEFPSLRAIKEQRVVKDVVIGVKKESGDIIWTSVSAAPLSYDSNSCVTVTTDITKRKQFESELRVSATAFETQEGILITDENNVMLRTNAAFTAITGYTNKEAIGQNPRLLSSGRQNASFYSAMWKAINTTGVWEGEIWNRRKNGEIYPEHLTVTAVKDRNGMVTNYVGVLSDLTQRKAAEEKIENLAFFDPLTKLPNRRLLLDRLKQAMASATRSVTNGAVLFIDLDNFKALNDTYGHPMGDLLLQQVAKRLVSSVRDGDTVSRFGGDEFVVLLEGFDENPLDAASQAETVGEQIFAALRQPYLIGTHEYHGTSSIGATLFNDKQQSIDELMKQADIAMYQAKKEGRNVLRFFDPQMQETIAKRTALEGDLRKAIENHQFQLHYQIQVDESRHPFGAEALIRWFHPEHGMVSPDQFIPLAEESDLILPIGYWVLETACARIQRWQHDAKTSGFVLSVNVSAKQFRQTDFVNQVQSLIQQYEINPSLLKLELTESMLLDNIEDTIATMSALKELGVKFSLDDFGTGYSSLQYLKRLPLDQLKIDQSFVRDIAVDASDRAIVRTIIAMAHSLDLDVIAEGVETEEQQKHLSSKGCKNFQGYLFGKPVPIEQFETSLRKSLFQPADSCHE
ncbi:sensor domain-containing protein [Gallionella capsiferriformans]|uniref:Diguanylate cyclase/phosphodiesterase with PAS/PAC sensor(S) n=1 Tax=Gallionella capsiferriformans (strain ES-2) TaxID=395494 RepID=D9SCE6_GALCS|nr:GGDEF and EAL domain-containing protein [Gallionella capsiferriformans]ADL56527.1 diguanylate cyclase/phosphodiesterase with PAS/PAC sensor(s) [Gallionella capsiferriformans ES-2]